MAAGSGAVLVQDPVIASSYTQGELRSLKSQVSPLSPFVLHGDL